MPEGDSIHRLRAEIAPVLEGREVTAFAAKKMHDEVTRGFVGRRIEEVSAHGKNLLIRFDDGRALHIHLRMNGRLWVERPRSSFWRARTSVPDVRIAVGKQAIVGRDLPVLRILTPLQQKDVLARLGPDLTSSDADAAQALEGLRARRDQPIAEALLVQSAAAGIGNVYKSEVLFLEKIDPRKRVGEISVEALRAVVARASTLLQRNLTTRRRTTRPALTGPRVWVYGRGGRPCLRCGTTIERFTQGGRSTYFCPSCQT